MHRLFIALLLSVLSCCLSHGKVVSSNVTLYQHIPDTIKLFFRFNSSQLQKEYLENSRSLQKIDSMLSRVNQSQIDSITVMAYASPDGNRWVNNRMANERARAVKGYLVWKYPQLNQYQIIAKSLGENWDGLRQAVYNDQNTPCREQILDIIDFTYDPVLKKQALETLDGAKPYTYIVNNILRYLRSTATCLVWYKADNVPLAVVSGSVAELVAKPACSEIDDYGIDLTTSYTTLYTTSCAQSYTTLYAQTHHQSYPKSYPQPHARPQSSSKTGNVIAHRWAIKNNVLYDAILLPNVEFEFYFGRRWSLNVDYQCAWWNFSSGDKYYQLMAASPEMRLWLRGDSGFRGHFFGLYLGAGYYDLKRSETGYQGEFYIASGLSYGYMLPLTPRFGLEFSVGVGYMITQYEKYTKYDPLDNHYVYMGKDRTSYFGPSKAKMSLVWRFGDKRRGGVR